MVMFLWVMFGVSLYALVTAAFGVMVGIYLMGAGEVKRARGIIADSLRVMFGVGFVALFILVWAL